MQHNNRLWSSDVLTDSNVVRQRCLLTTFGHINHCNVSIIELIQHISLSKVQSLKIDMMKINC